MNIKECSNFFYIPANEGIGGLKYVVDSDMHALYLIKKSGLPKEIRDQLVGGDAGNGEYGDYLSLNDVYGVTSDLKVYYCSNGLDSIQGLAKDNLDNDNPERVVFDTSSKMSELLEKYDLDKDGTITAQETKSVKALTITDSDGVTSLDGLYNLNSLKELTLENLNLANMNGVENTSLLEYIYFKNCKVADYKAIGLMGKKLTHLYFYNVDDNEIATACSPTTGIGGANLSGLQYFAIVGNESYICSNSNSYPITKTAKKTISSISPLSNLSSETKGAIKYLSLQCNTLTSIAELKDFTGLYLVRLEGNNLKTLGEINEKGEKNGLWNCENLTYLYANGNFLGTDEVATLEGAEIVGKDNKKDSLACLEGKGVLNYLRLNTNSEIKWVEYLSGITSLRYLYLDDCLKFVNVGQLKNVKNNCGGNFSINNKYELDLLDLATESLDLSDKSLKLDTFEGLGNCTALYRLNLANLKLLDTSETVITNEATINKTINDVLSNLKEMQFLKLQGISGLSTIDFVGANKVTKLKELDIRGTKITNLTALKTYGLNMRAFIADNPDINLSEIQTFLNNCNWGVAGNLGSDYWCNGSGSGVMICSQGLLDKLISCTELTRYVSNNEVFFNVTKKIDLHNCSKLKEVNVRGFSGELWLPKTSIDFIGFWQNNANLIVSFFDPSSNEIIENEGNGVAVKTLDIQSCSMVNSENWRFLKGLSCEYLKYYNIWNEGRYSTIFNCGINYESVHSLWLGEYDGSVKNINEDLTRFGSF